jgi:N-methylhydantoinase B
LPNAEELDNNDLVVCMPGDVIRLIGAGAGGYGRPIERDIDKVLDDVRRGYVSVSEARDTYAVAINDDAIDHDVTAELRARAQADIAGDVAPAFAFGPYREAFEAKWTLARYEALTAILASVPVQWRYFIKHQIFDALDKRIAADAHADAHARVDAEIGDSAVNDVTAHATDAAVVHTLFAELCVAYPQLRQSV